MLFLNSAHTASQYCARLLLPAVQSVYTGQQERLLVGLEGP